MGEREGLGFRGLGFRFLGFRVQGTQMIMITRSHRIVCYVAITAGASVYRYLHCWSLGLELALRDSGLNKTSFQGLFAAS